MVHCYSRQNDEDDLQMAPSSYLFLIILKHSFLLHLFAFAFLVLFAEGILILLVDTKSTLSLRNQTSIVFPKKSLA